MADLDYNKFNWVQSAKERREAIVEEPTGIGAKPTSQQEPMDKGFYESMYEAIMSYFDNAEEADRVLTAKEIDKDRVKGEVLREFDALDSLLSEDTKTPSLDAYQAEDIDARMAEFDAQVGRYRDAIPAQIYTMESETEQGSGLKDVTDTDEGKLTNEEPLYKMAEEIDPGTIKTEGIMSKPSDDSADGVQPTDGKDFDQTVMSFVEENEGRKNTPYKDTKGLWTVGVGHLIGKELPAKYKNADGTPRTLSDEEVQALFDEDYAKHKKEASSLPMYDQLDTKGKQALIDLTFNMGLSKFNENKWPKFFSALKNKDLKTAAAELKDSEWFKEVKTRAPKVISLINEASFI